MDKEGLYETARHEAVHALVAHWYNWPVLSLSATGWHEGKTQMLLPFAPLELPKHYRQVPSGARRDLTRILAMTIAPSLVNGHPVNGADERDLDCWRYVWERCRYASDPFGPPGETLIDQARAEVHLWLASGDCQERLGRVAGVLARCHYLTGAAFLQLLRPAPPARSATINPLRKEDTPCATKSWRTSGRVCMSPITVL